MKLKLDENIPVELLDDLLAQSLSGRLVVATEVLGRWQDVGEGKMVVLDLEGILGEPPALFDLPLGAEVGHGGEAQVGQTKVASADAMALCTSSSTSSVTDIRPSPCDLLR